MSFPCLWPVYLFLRLQVYERIEQPGGGGSRSGGKGGYGVAATHASRLAVRVYEALSY
jgi:hypothetical protein